MNIKIFLIADDQHIEFQEKLEKIGFGVFLIDSNEKDAELKKIDSEVIFIDANSARKNNYTFLQLLGLSNNLVFIFSNIDDYQEIEKFFSYKIVDYIRLSINIVELKARINNKLQTKIYFDQLKCERSFLSKIVNIDPLTKLYNKQYFHQRLTIMCSKFNTLKNHIIVLMDVDNFKQINDLYGYLNADGVLQEVANVLTENLRKNDLIARFGGDEFIFFLGNCSLIHASEVVERLRKKIADKKYFNSNVQITASFGIVEYHEQSVEELINQANKQLYKAKQKGKNKVCI